MTDKHCPDCEITKPIDQFYRMGVGNRYYSRQCKQCYRSHIAARRGPRTVYRVRFEHPKYADKLAKIKQYYLEGDTLASISETCNVSIVTLSKMKRLGIIVKRPRRRIIPESAETTPETQPETEENDDN